MSSNYGNVVSAPVSQADQFKELVLVELSLVSSGILTTTSLAFERRTQTVNQRALPQPVLQRLKVMLN